MSKMKARGTAAAARGPQARQQQPARKIPVVGIALGALAVFLVAAVAFTGGGSSSDEERFAEAAGSPVITGSDLSLYNPEAPDQSVGAIAPEVTGTDYNDQLVAIEHDGNPKAVLFLAHWCSHCQAEVPRVQTWLNETGGVPGVEIVSVATAYNPAQGNWSPEDWLTDVLDLENGHRVLLSATYRDRTCRRPGSQNVQRF